MNTGRETGEQVSLASATATGQRMDAVLAHIATKAAVHVPPLVRRDPELIQIHAEAGRFFQACLHGSWVPEYLADPGLDAALLPSSPWKIGYAPFSLL
jgi:hypothetical protein